MSLTLYQRPNGIYHLRGTVQKQRVDESTRTRDLRQAQQIKAERETELFRRAVFGAKAVATFAEAATIYMEAGKSEPHLAALIAEIGLTPLRSIDQNFVDRLAARMKPDAKPATRIRQIYTPVSAVMNFVAPKLCDPVRFEKPKGTGARVDYLTPADAEILIGFLSPQLRCLVIFLIGTGCRISEALELRWKDVSSKNGRAVFWDTKMNYPRGVDLQQRVRDEMPSRSKNKEDFVFLNNDGAPWRDYDAINFALRRACSTRLPDGRLRTNEEKAWERAGNTLPRFRHVHCHLFRHTWATWAYSVTTDLTFLMASGGWRSATMVMRYAHAASRDLAADVKAHGWEIRGT
ncbi:tyrosine-type recombinase/integrase [Brevundimonas diminuta]|uniref:tyrosine-type recombinase/integrase n=1 Tax=Brevundimonas diminuta TaxID=293 RepID=UPI0037C5386C